MVGPYGGSGRFSSHFELSGAVEFAAKWCFFDSVEL
jgi:hypothetical protein